VVSAAATLLGLLMAGLASPLLDAALPPLPYRFAVSATPDGEVLVLMAGGALLAALLCGLAPALRAASGHSLAELLPHPRGTSPGPRLRALTALSGATLVFCCVTLVLSSLFGRSLDAAAELAPGFETRDRATASVDVALAGPEATAPDRYYQGLLEALARLPGVRDVAVASNVPLMDRQEQAEVFDASHPGSPDEVGPQAWVARVSEAYFDTLGQPLLAGRPFFRADRRGPAVAIVSRELARRLWPDQDAVGQRIRIGAAEREVVGVAADARYELISEAPRPALYLPFWPNAPERGEVVVRAVGPDPDLPSRIREVARAVDPRIPVFGEKTLAVHVNGSLWMFRLAAGLAVGLGLLAASLALAGLYGVMAYAAQERRTEVGIRLALGATRGGVVATLVGRGARLIAVAVCLGLVASAWAAQLASGLVIGVSPRDPTALLVVGLAVAALALLACLVPSLAASRVDPARSLRGT
jgi:putative ABC transport system permease protein